MGLALYRKYRPKKLSDVVGQDAIIQTLSNSLKNSSLSHAYLFTGPRGVGKTSIARILAHEINQLEYTDDSTHLDIIEIDAASNRRIDEIRDLRDKIHIAPTSAKYKVYIIDEVHMLTREAFNALLKTLEEPPQHAIFILATTEVHKVPDTIISRTQRFTFKPIANDTAVLHLQSIAKKENITIDTESLTLIAEHSRGSFRDAINLLDQLSSTNKVIAADDVRTSIGIPSDSIVSSLLEALDAVDPHKIIETVQSARYSGIHAATLALHLADKLRDRIVSGAHPTINTMTLLKSLSSVGQTAQAYIELELVLLTYIAAQVESQTTAPPIQKTLSEVPDVPSQKIKKEATEVKPITSNTQPVTQLPDNALWHDVLAVIKTNHNTLYGILRMAEPRFSNDSVELAFKFPFHQKQMSSAKNTEHIVSALAAAYGKTFTVTCVVDSSAQAASLPKEAEQMDTKTDNSGPINDISNIFDGAELLE